MIDRPPGYADRTASFAYDDDYDDDYDGYDYDDPKHPTYLTRLFDRAAAQHWGGVP